MSLMGHSLENGTNFCYKEYQNREDLDGQCN